METGGAWLQNSRGMVLMSTLAILSVLLAVGIGIRVMLRNDYQVLANLRGGTEAFYFSVAGLEWSKSEITRATVFPPVPPNQTRFFSSGGFAVSFLSPTVVGPLTVRVVVRSVGTLGSASHVLQAQLTKSYDLADAGLGLRGNASRVNVSGSPIFISGVDHDPATSNPVPGAQARQALSASDETLRGLVAQALGAAPQQGILDSSSAVPAVETSDFLPASVISQFASGLCGSPGVSVTSIPSNGDLTLDNQTWGSQASPQLRCIEGLPISGDGVTLTGTNTGAGILVVKDASLVLSGSFRWDGLIIISGNEVSFRVLGSSSKEILGAVMVNEAGSPESSMAILDIQGTLRLLFSRQALARAAVLVSPPILANTYAALPSGISQQYWRTVSP
jgi:hypothetical protein